MTDHNDDDLTYMGLRDDPHENAVDVRTSGGDTYAVAIAEVLGDGSESVVHYTEEQARAIRDALDDVLAELDAETRDAALEEAGR